MKYPMARLHVYWLRPRGAFRFGKSGIDAEKTSEHCPSDTLYAALATEALLGGCDFLFPPTGPGPGEDERAGNDDAPPDPPFLLSSAYPYAGTVLLLPRPLLPLRPLLRNQEQARRLARVAYVSPTIFVHILKQSQQQPPQPHETPLDAYLPSSGGPSQGTLAMDGRVWIAHADGTPPDGQELFWSIHHTPYLRVDRVRPASHLFHTAQVSFAPGCGLSVLCEERKPGGAEGLKALLQRLGDSGLGGKRAAGAGQFDVDGPSFIELPESPRPTRLVLLSRYRPSTTELAANVLGPGARYHTVSVGGYFQSLDPDTAPQQRQTVCLLGEGSVVRALPDGRPPIGTICNLAPNPASDASDTSDIGNSPTHPVWRYGLALGVGVGD
ncbi:MAG: hypothetical protein HC884_03745 [Chloroflexaceae bacterium]|nr:hypothetical protein [Chloroflexaceae bacterium]